MARHEPTEQGPIDALLPILQGATDPIVALSARGEIAWANRAARELLAIEEGAEQLEALDRSIGDALGRLARGESREERVDAAGSESHTWSLEAIRSESGCVVRGRASHPASSEALAQQIAGIGDFLWDLGDGSARWSEQLLSLFEAERALSFEEWLEHITLEEQERARSFFQEVASNPASVRSTRLRYNCPSGALKLIEIRCVPRFDASCDRVTGVLGTIQDVSASQRVEEALRARAIQLEISNQSLNDFASSASHDLQEPLRKMRTFAERLASRISKSGDERALDYLTRIQGSAERMHRLVQSLLELSRVSVYELKPEPIDMNELADELESLFEVALEESGAELEIETLHHKVWCDASQFFQLVQNLLGNAIKFRQRERPPRIQIWDELERDAWGQTLYIFHVRDEGIGMEAHHAERIFEPFERLHGRTSEYSGSGIGLAICQRIAQRHGGTIEVESSPNQGAHFCVAIPQPCDLHAASAQRESATPAAGINEKAGS